MPDAFFALEDEAQARSAAQPATTSTKAGRASVQTTHRMGKALALVGLAMLIVSASFIITMGDFDDDDDDVYNPGGWDADDDDDPRIDRLKAELNQLTPEEARQRFGALNSQCFRGVGEDPRASLLKAELHMLTPEEATRRFREIRPRCTAPPRQRKIDHFVVLYMEK